MMHRRLLFFTLFATTQLLQAFLFNNLTLTVWCNPLIYVVYVLMLPLDTPRGSLLAAGLAAGLAADWFMGGAGLNTIATVAVAFARPLLLGLFFDKENLREGGIPSPERLGSGGFFRYAALFVLLHHLLFFGLESLSLTHLVRTLVRVAASSSATLLLGWLLVRLFTSKITVKI